MKDERLYLEHIREAVAKVFVYTADGRAEFMKQTLIQDGVVRNFEVIGEAVKNLGESIRRKRPDIPWSDIARFRDILIHHYMEVDLQRVWNVVETYLPTLRDAVDELLRS